MKKNRSFTQARGGFKVTGGDSRVPFMEKIQTQKNETNYFDLSNTHTTTGQMGKIIPARIIEVYAGDSIDIGMGMFTRLAPMVFPAMQRLSQSGLCAFVPKRLLWDNYDNWLAGEATGGKPRITIDGSQSSAQEQFIDYFGIPPFAGSGGSQDIIEAMPFAAYQKMYEDLFRDQNIVSEIDYKCTDGAQSAGKEDILLTQRYVSYNRDYFTSMLPTAQAGAEVELPFNVNLNPSWGGGGSAPKFVDGSLSPAAGALAQNGANEITVGGLPAYAYDPDGSLISDPITVSTWRKALALQKIKEMFMRGGRKFKEIMISAFGTDPGDARLDRTEYIFGTKIPIKIADVLNTAGTFDPGNPLDPASRVMGDMAGMATGYGGKDYDGKYQVKEHGYLIFVTFVTPETAYNQGIERMWKKFDWEDELWPQFAHLSEQAVEKSELVAYEPDSNSTTIGYLPMYAHDRFKSNLVTGRFRDTLRAWTLVRELDPVTAALNADLIECKPEDNDRIFAVQTANNDNLYMELAVLCKVQRQLPLYGTPGL